MPFFSYGPLVGFSLYLTGDGKTAIRAAGGKVPPERRRDFGVRGGVACGDGRSRYVLEDQADDITREVLVRLADDFVAAVP